LANNSRLVTTAELGKFAGDMTLFVATQATAGLARTGVSAQAWEKYCEGVVRIIEVNAEHHQMLSPATLRQIGRIL
jgi:thioesterase domain-containing protein